MKRILISFTPLVGQGKGGASSTKISELFSRPDSLPCFSARGRPECDNGELSPSRTIFFSGVPELLRVQLRFV